MSVTAVPLQPVKSSVKTWLWLGLLVAVIFGVGLAYTGTRAAVAAKGSNEEFLAWNKRQPGVVTTATGVQILEIKAPIAGSPAVADGDGVILNIQGSFRDGTVFQPQGADQWLVNPQDRIPGYVEAVKTMRKGGKYRVWIPAAQGYGANPPSPQMRKDAVLIFDVEVQDHLTAAQINEMRQQQAAQQAAMQAQIQAAQGNSTGNSAGGE